MKVYLDIEFQLIAIRNQMTLLDQQMMQNFGKSFRDKFAVAITIVEEQRSKVKTARDNIYPEI